jgi:hypothetical protein
VFRKITQKAKEAVGSTGTSNYAEEVKDGLGKAKLMKKNLDELMAVLAAHQKQQVAAIESSKVLAAEFAKFGESLKEANMGDDHAELSQVGLVVVGVVVVVVVE